MQWVTLGLIALNVLVYVFVNVLGFPSLSLASLGFGHVPSVANDIRVLPGGAQIVPDDFYFLTAITASFLHADVLHLGGNMLFIWVFGDNVEDAMGHFKYLVFYIACAFAASWFHALSFPTSDSPLIGASGAAAGVLTAYLILHPRMKIWVLFLGRIPLRLPAYILLGGWVAYQLFMYVTDSTSQISWAAHVGGAACGAVLVFILKRWSVPLFDREVQLPQAVELEPAAELPEDVKPAPPEPARTRKLPWGRNAAK